MRFYRAFFWFLAILQWSAGLWFCLLPAQVRSSFGHDSAPLILFQLQGLIFFVLASGFAYVAEQPGQGVPVVSLATLTKSLILLFSFVAYLADEIGSLYFRFVATLELGTLPFVISYFFWYYHKPRPNRFVPLIGLFGEKK